MFKEFKEFAIKGNVIDLAVGVIIGGAFGKIVTSLVNDIIMPVLSILLSIVNFRDLKYVITPAKGDAEEVAILYGSFIQSVVDFLIIAFSIFLFVKLINSLKKREKKEAEEAGEANESAEVPAPSKEALLLEEIRDLLKQK
ncbi:MAG: large-conductance mechanosensitive channel protein MscL [Bacillota bacterium]